MKSLVIWTDCEKSVVETKGWYTTKRGKKHRYGIHKWYGDIPVAVLNCTTNKTMPVVSRRGLAYSFRKDLKFRKGYVRYKLRKIL